MPRPRSLSLSPKHSRPAIFLTDTFTPPKAASTLTVPGPTSSAPQAQKGRYSRYSPYVSSRLSVSSTPFSSSCSASGSGSEVDTASSSDSEGTSLDVSRPVRDQPPTADPAAPISSRFSLLGLDKPSTMPRDNVFSFAKPPPRSKASIRFAHRRTQSLSIPPSYGYIILPQKTPTTPIFAPHLSPVTSSSPSSAQIATPLTDIRSLSIAPNEQSGRRTSLDRMMLVNPAIAAHLKKGGVVAMRTPDGLRRWRIRLPKESVTNGLGL